MSDQKKTMIAANRKELGQSLDGAEQRGREQHLSATRP
jgi:hypothetical protein